MRARASADVPLARGKGSWFQAGAASPQHCSPLPVPALNRSCGPLSPLQPHSPAFTLCIRVPPSGRGREVDGAGASGVAPLTGKREPSPPGHPLVLFQVGSEKQALALQRVPGGPRLLALLEGVGGPHLIKGTRGAKPGVWHREAPAWGSTASQNKALEQQPQTRAPRQQRTGCSKGF